MRITTAAIGWAFAIAIVAIAMLELAPQAHAQTAREPAIQMAQNDEDAQPPRRRPRIRIYQYDDRGVSPSYNPGPNAVRECSAAYVQEFRPSGTVITPRMNCYWRRG